ncbi:MAG TPA: threonine/serine exporter family protein, partial [Roseiflexaceae bacterium]|nr:threonine/serine exporter family protein [Roseiflexaceae bacterium]
GVLGEICARLFKQPTALFTIPGFIPLVPGSAAFRTLLEFVAADYTAGTASFVRTALLTAALAAGLGTVNALARIHRQPLA